MNQWHFTHILPLEIQVFVLVLTLRSSLACWSEIFASLPYGSLAVLLLRSSVGCSVQPNGFIWWGRRWWEAGRLQGCVILEPCTSPDPAHPNLLTCCRRGSGGRALGSKASSCVFCLAVFPSPGINGMEGIPLLTIPFSVLLSACEEIVFRTEQGRTGQNQWQCCGTGQSSCWLCSTFQRWYQTLWHKQNISAFLCLEQSCFGLPQVCTSLPGSQGWQHSSGLVPAAALGCWFSLCSAVVMTALEATPGCPGGAGGSTLCRAPCWGRLLPLLSAQMVPTAWMGSTGCLLWSLAAAPNYFQASREPRLLKSPWWLKKVSVGRAVLHLSSEHMA